MPSICPTNSPSGLTLFDKQGKHFRNIVLESIAAQKHPAIRLNTKALLIWPHTAEFYYKHAGIYLEYT